MKCKLTVEEALERLTNGLVLEDCLIEGELYLGQKPLGNDLPAVHQQLHLVSCKIEGLNAACVLFHRPVSLLGCSIHQSSFHAAYFFQGLEILDCEFEKPVDFSAGGHNPPEYRIRIVNTVFHDFVDFEDCLYEGPVEVVRCQFEKGTNLLHWVQHSFGLAETGSLTTDGNVGKVDVREEKGGG